MSRNAYILTMIAGTLGLSLISCNQLRVSQEAAPIVFKGLKSVESTAKGNLILRWDQPENIPVAGFEVFRQELTPKDPEQSTAATGGSSALRLVADDAPTAGISTVIQELPDADAPVTKGKLLQVVAGDLNSLELQSPIPGYYAFQVRAISSDGRSDGNTRIILLTMESEIGYPGIAKADLNGTDLYLEWPPLATNLKGQSVNYTVFEGPTFNKSVAITTETSMRLSLRGAKPGATLTYGVRSTDPKGRTDRNTKVLSVKIPEATSVFEGCIRGEPRGADRIRILFAWPEEEFETFQIFRNGTQVFATRDKGVTAFVDVGLTEGEVYSYSCAVTYKDLVLTGSNRLSVSTLTSNSPTFRGARSVEVTSAHSAKIRWGVSTGVPTKTFNVYANLGSKVNWQGTPVKTVGSDVLEVELGDLGDELTYAFGVRACSIKGVCDTNEISLVATTADDGPPRTTGVASLSIRDGKLWIKAPWSPALGGVDKRFVYIKTDGDASTDLSTYVNAMTIPISNQTQVPTELAYTNVSDNTTYHVIVRDRDAAGNLTAAVAPVSINSGDTTPPTFAGITSLGVGTEAQKETSLAVRFRALVPENAQNKYGAWEYLAYVVPGTSGACTANSIHQIFPASSFSASQDSELFITGLAAKTTYNVCLKARDKAGNISATTVSASRSTLDTTAPAFDGVQSTSFDKEKGELALSWTPSSAADLYEYEVQIWKSNSDPTQVPVTTLRFPATVATSGVSLSPTTVSLNSNEDVYVLVNACDDGSRLAGGAQNCSALTIPRMISLPDIEPPPGFLGIAAEPQLTTPAQGTIIVRWIAPSDWSDYKGFKVYLVNRETNTLIQSPVWDCPCSTQGCPSPVTSCEVTGLDVFRTYVFHVRAYDVSGNVTQLDPAVFSTAKRSSDTSPPTFNSALTVLYSDASTTLTWSQATDNQYAAEPGAQITYEVWRKTTDPFSNATNPDNLDANLMATVSDLTWRDPGDDYVGGRSYYYTVCAKDGTGNRRCDGNVKSITTPDLIPPEISSFTTNKNESDWQWSLNWTASDNATPSDQLFIRIYVKYSDLATDKATTENTQIVAQSGITTKTSLKGPPNVNKYLHYLLEVRDNDGNKATRYLTVRSNNLVTISGVRSTEGALAGGKTLVIVGDGFKPDATVAIGASDCSTVRIISRKHILCNAPPATQVDTVPVTVTNPDGSSASLADAYRYCEPSVSGSCQNICNRPSAWSGTFAVGNGLAATSPFVICNASHLNNMRNQPYGRFYTLGENIDLQGTSFAPITNPSTWDFRGSIDGNNFVIANFNYSDINQDRVGLFKVLNFSDIRDLGLINFQVSGRSLVGSLAGAAGMHPDSYAWNSEYVSIDGVFATGAVDGVNTDIGGVVGRFYGNAQNTMSFANVTGAVVVGGVFGRKNRGGSNLEYNGDVLARGISNNCYVGGVTGYWDAGGFSISQLSSTGTVTCRDDQSQGARFTGGGIGQLINSSLDGSTANTQVIGHNYVGGIVGQTSNVTMTNAVSSGAVTGRYYVGGLTGEIANGKIITCTNNATVTAAVPVKNPPVTGSHTAGGITGVLYGSTAVPAVLKDCTNSKAVSSVWRAGGLAGYARDFQMETSSSSGDILTSAAEGRAGGGIGEMIRGVVTDSYATGTVTALSGDYAGGFAGLGHEGVSTMQRVRASGPVTGRNSIGGLAGHFRGIMKDSNASGLVTGNQNVGGLIGWVQEGAVDTPNKLEKNIATGEVVGDTRCGGMVGMMRRYTQVTQSAASGKVTCATYAGGFVAEIYAGDDTDVSIQQSMSRGAVSGNTNVGGFLGVAWRNNSHRLVISDCYARGNVKGNQNVGGFAGQVGDVVTKVYASGKVQKDSSETNIGGLLGALWSPDGPRDFPYSYWDTEASGRTSSRSGVGKTTRDMLGSSLYGDWDAQIWSFDTKDYPRLRWELSP